MQWDGALRAAAMIWCSPETSWFAKPHDSHRGLRDMDGYFEEVSIEGDPPFKRRHLVALRSTQQAAAILARHYVCRAAVGTAAAAAVASPLPL